MELRTDHPNKISENLINFNLEYTMVNKNNSHSTFRNSVCSIIGIGALYFLCKALDRELANMDDSQDNNADAHNDIDNRESRRAKVFHNYESNEPYYQKFNHNTLK